MAGVAQEMLPRLLPERMNLPLYKGAAERRPTGVSDGHAGLWFDKFCDHWRIDRGKWTMAADKSNPKLDWIKTLTTDKIGDKERIQESASRLARLIERRAGCWDVFTAAWRFVTGLGRSHPVENGFAWHPTLGTPYLPGSSMKGLVRAWAELDADPKPDCATVERLLGSPGNEGAICFLDAIPIQPVQLDADVMTPHYGGWTPDAPPGDWRSPTPIPFLVTAAETPLLFGFVPRGAVSSEDMDTVDRWLKEALAGSGAGAKTAVGYGRFDKDDGKTDELKRQLQDEDRKRETALRHELEAAERARRLSSLSPIEQEIEKIIDTRNDKNMAEITAIMQEAERDRWTGEAKIEVAEWLEKRMKQDGRWKERTGAKNPDKDRNYRDTLKIKRLLGRA